MADKSQLSEKASRYIHQLSQARCEGRWADVPELARKVEKHAPWKNCMTIAARTEAAFEQDLGHAERGGFKLTGVPEAIDTILLSVKESKATSEEVFQARTCIQWLHWVDGQWDPAIICIAPDAAPRLKVGTETNLMEWTEICVLKSAFLRGASLEARGRTTEALAIFQETVSQIISSHSPVKDTPQWKLWAERLLNRYALLIEPAAVRDDASNEDLTNGLELFRAWARSGSSEKFASGMKTGGLALETRLSRRQTWISYYKLLSSLVVKITAPRSSHHSVRVGDIAIPSRLELSTEIQRIESVYNGLLIKEVAFPQAHEYNAEIDDWTNLVMANWAVFVGPAWPAEHVPQGGKRAVSKRVLEILYRDATRTFHSMTILRHLSTVHASLGEFDLATRALESYVTIGAKAKARIQKSKEAEPGVDSDDTFVSAIAAGIEMFCTFGGRTGAIKAQELSTLLRQLLDEDVAERQSSPSKTHQQTDQDKLAQQDLHMTIHSRTLSLAHRAIGISSARWSCLTYEPAGRSDLQSYASQYLRKSLRGSPGNENSLETLYALSLAAAESRETQGAVAALKQALSQLTLQDPGTQLSRPDTAPQPLQPTTATIRCWHLLTLLLSSRQDFDTAAESCDAALEELSDLFRSTNASAVLDTAEKRSMISLRMSRIALKELLEGSDAAVNDSMTLLALYGEMFKAKSREPDRSTDRLSIPSSGPTRSRSLRRDASLRGKKDRSSQAGSLAGDTKSARRFSDPANQKRPDLRIPDEPIQSARPTTSRSQRSLSRSNSKKLQKRPSKRSVSKPGVETLQQPTTEHGETLASAEKVNKSAIGAAPPQLSPLPTGNNLQSQVGLAISSEEGEESTATLPEEGEPPIPLVQCLTVHYSDEEESKRSQQTLIEIWVFIAGLYRRAQLYSDAASACIEALKQVRTLESAIAITESSADALARPGWGDDKSVEELRADILAEQGYLKLEISGSREATQDFESALAHYADHIGATVGLSNILLDIYEKKLPAEETRAAQTGPEEILAGTSTSKPVLATVPGVTAPTPAAPETKSHARKPSTMTLDASRAPKKPAPPKKSTSPETLDRLAARDRAYNLLAALSKLGTGWDQSEVWLCLARAHELSGQLDKAQEALWWVVELEKKRPIRHWRCLGQGYSLWY